MFCKHYEIVKVIKILTVNEGYEKHINHHYQQELCPVQWQVSPGQHF
jgi:hypothetical protein